MKVSQRFKLLVSYVKKSSSLYDLCCDHGMMGIYAYESGITKKIYFVDRVASIMARLESKVRPFITDESEVHFVTADAKDIKVVDNASIILAGVGDALGANILKSLIDTKKQQRWIISLQKFNVETRKFLNSIEVDLIEDKVFKEKSRYRELIVFDLPSKNQDKIDLVPSYVENPTSEDERVYSKLYLEFIKAKSKHNS